MSASAEFVEYIKDQFQPLGDLKKGGFFGGYAFKKYDTQFAMIMGNTLYFCVNDVTRPLYIAEEMEPFSYTTKKGTIQVKKYYTAPETLFEDQELLLDWARQAIEAACSYKQ